MPAASLIKLLIAYALANDVANGVLSWDTRLMVTSRDAVDGSPAFGPRAGSGATVDALAFAMLAQSDNTASNVLLGRLGFARANEAARKLGLAQTSVERRFYDWAAQRRGRENRTSPRDVGELLAWFVRASETASTSAHDRALRDGAERVLRALYAQEDRETIPGALPDRRIANKTGELTGYRHDAAIVGAGRARYVLVAMTHYRGERAEAVARIRGLARTVDAREREIVSSGLRVNRAALG